MKSRLKRDFNVEWDKDNGCYKGEKMCTVPWEALDNIESGSPPTCTPNDEESIAKSSSQVSNDKTDDALECPSNNSKSEQEKKLDDIAHIINYLDTLNKNLNLLDTRLKKIENSIDKIVKDNPNQRLKDFADEFINIYASDKKRKSVKINSQIRERIIEHISKVYDIQSDDTLAVNTALLVALYSAQFRGLSSNS